MLVSEMLDALADGDITLDDAVEWVGSRRWPSRKPASDAVAWGAEDDDAPDDNSWATVEVDPRLSADDYEALAEAYSGTFNGKRQ